MYATPGVGPPRRNVAGLLASCSMSAPFRSHSAYPGPGPSPIKLLTSLNLGGREPSSSSDPGTPQHLVATMRRPAAQTRRNQLAVPVAPAPPPQAQTSQPVSQMSAMLCPTSPRPARGLAPSAAPGAVLLERAPPGVRCVELGPGTARIRALLGQAQATSSWKTTSWDTVTRPDARSKMWYAFALG